jgi:hypothetical protein
MRQLLGGILIAVGILIAGASGVCSLYMLFTSDTFRSGAGISELLSILPLMLMFGGIPFAAGVALIFGGRSMIRRAREEPAEVDSRAADTFE